MTKIHSKDIHNLWKSVIAENSIEMALVCITTSIVNIFKCFSSKWTASKTGKQQWLWTGFRRAFCKFMLCSGSVLAHGSFKVVQIVHVSLANLEECPLAPSSFLVYLYRCDTYSPNLQQKHCLYCKLHNNSAAQVNKNSSSRCTSETASNCVSPTILEKQLMQKGYCTQKEWVV